MFLSAGVNLNSKTQKAQDIKLLQKIFSRVYFSNYLILLMEHIGSMAKVGQNWTQFECFMCIE